MELGLGRCRWHSAQALGLSLLPSLPFILPVPGLAFPASLSVFPSLCVSISYLSLPHSFLSLIFHCICFHFSAVVTSPHGCPASALSLSPSAVSPALSLSLLAGRMGEEAQGRCGPGSLPAAAGLPRICGFRLLYLGLQLPLIFWLQDTRPGLGQPGPRTQGGRARLAGDEGQGAGRCVLWGACEP